jgi:hypothetical protein
MFKEKKAKTKTNFTQNIFVFVSPLKKQSEIKDLFLFTISRSSVPHHSLSINANGCK